MDQCELSCILLRGVPYLLLVQHVVWVFRAHTKTRVPVLKAVMGGAVVDLRLLEGPVVGGAVEGGTVIDGTVE